jgi:hypothetical protein
MCISAVQHLRRLRGGAQSHLLRASDGASYVTKFQNNPQHIRVLANEMLATRLGLAQRVRMMATVGFGDSSQRHRSTVARQ